MGKLSYVVVSTPRSATGWASQALTAMGLQCGHEAHYSLHKECDCVGTLEGMWGDSSWLAVPFIKDLPPGTVVLHQVRNPWDTIASIVGLGWFGPDCPIPEDEYRMFAQEHLIGRIPGDSPEASEVQRAAHFWMTWHMMIELYAIGRADLSYYRIRVESPTAAAQMYRAIKKRLPEASLVSKADAIDRKYNSRTYAKPNVTAWMQEPRVVSLATRYGYPSEKLVS